MSGGQGVALVTGAARRIGRAIAEHLAADGYDLALHSSARSAGDAEALASELRARGGKAHVVIADLADAANTATLVSRASVHGVLRLLVNNASLFEDDRAGTVDPARLDRILAVNLRAPAQLAAAFVAALPSGLDGAIINIVDQRVWRLNPLYYSYTLSKSALWTATQVMAQSFAPRVRVNAVAPGPTLANQFQDGAAFSREAKNVPLERGVEPTEIAEAVAWLAKARAVTGQMIAVDGGQHLAWKTPDVEI